MWSITSFSNIPKREPCPKMMDGGLGSVLFIPLGSPALQMFCGMHIAYGQDDWFPPGVIYAWLSGVLVTIFHKRLNWSNSPEDATLGVRRTVLLTPKVTTVSHVVMLLMLMSWTFSREFSTLLSPIQIFLASWLEKGGCTSMFLLHS